MKVSVLLTTYNHERFIAQAIDSVLMQEADFDYELVIIEDCSTDRTRDIIVKLQEKHPAKVRLILSETNVCNNVNFAKALQTSPSQYIALLDGDDFWTSPYKLQKLVTFLDAHPECALCFHNVTVFHEDGSQTAFNHNPANQKKFSTLEDLWSYNFIAGCSPVLRRGLVGELPQWYHTSRWGDWPLYVLYAQHGKIGYLDEVLGAYRVHGGGLWSGLSGIRKLEETVKFYESINANLNFRYNKTIQDMIMRCRVQIAIERSRSQDGLGETDVAVVEIVDVRLSERNPEQLWGCHVDLPKAGSHSEAQALDILGWVLGRSAPTVAVEVLHDGHVIRRVALGVHRPDLEVAFPHVPEAARGGFHASVSVLGTTAQLELRLQAVLQDQSRVPIGVIRARRGWQEATDAEVPLVSVIIPCYNQAHFLSEAVESVLKQSYPHFEIVVVDDGSMDNTEEVAARYPGVHCIRQENQGLAGARNSGIRRSNGSYLVFLDADDRLLPEALETGLAELKAHPECAFVSGQWNLIAFDGSPLPASQPPRVESDYYAALLQSCYISTPAAVMYRRAVFQSMTGFDSSVDACADYDLYLRIARQFPIYTHDEVVAEYRRHGSNMTRNPALMLKSELTVRRSQWPYVKGNNYYREAYRKGILDAQAYFGEPLVEEVRSHLQEREWQQALSDMQILRYYYPNGLASLALGSTEAKPDIDLALEQEVWQGEITELQDHNQELSQQNEAARHEVAELWQALREQAERIDTLTAQLEALPSRENEPQGSS